MHLNNKILITGATGSLGSMLISLLKEKTEITNLVVLVRDEKMNWQNNMLMKVLLTENLTNNQMI